MLIGAKSMPQPLNEASCIVSLKECIEVFQARYCIPKMGQFQSANPVVLSHKIYKQIYYTTIPTLHIK